MKMNISWVFFFSGLGRGLRVLQRGGVGDRDRGQLAWDTAEAPSALHRGHVRLHVRSRPPHVHRGDLEDGLDSKGELGLTFPLLILAGWRLPVPADGLLLRLGDVLALGLLLPDCRHWLVLWSSEVSLCSVFYTLDQP